MTAPRIPFARRAWATDDDERYDTDDDEGAPDYACEQCGAPTPWADCRQGFTDQIVCPRCHFEIWRPTLAHLADTQPPPVPRYTTIREVMYTLAICGGVWGAVALVIVLSGK